MALLPLAFITACDGGQRVASPTFSGPYAAEFESAYASATDPEVKAAIKDGVISRAEYEAANQRYVSCAADKGVKVSLEDQSGIYGYSYASSTQADKVLASCEPVVVVVSELYTKTTRNPDNVNFDELVLACLKKAGIVQRDYTATKLSADMKSRSTPFDPSTPEATACFANPLAAGG